MKENNYENHNSPPPTNKCAAVKERLHYIDRAKAVAMILVVFGHINLFDYYGLELLETNQCQVFGVTSLFQMVLFIFLSGLVVKTKRISLKDAVGQIYLKFRCLLMPLLIVGGLYTVWIYHHYPWDIFVLGDFVGYWYLWALFIFYLFHYIYQYISARMERKALSRAFDVFWFCIIFGTLKLCMKIVPDAGILSLSMIANLFPYFYFGVMLKKYSCCKAAFSSNALYTLGVLLSLAFFICRSYNVTYPLAYQTLGIGMTLAIVCTLYRLERKDNRVLRFLDYVGKNTLDVYIFHYFLIAAFKNLWVGEWMSSGHYSPVTEFLTAGIPAICFVVVSICIGKVVRQNSILSKLIFYK